jgi:hypothetical protein
MEENVMLTPDETLIVLPFEIVMVSVLVKLIDSPEVNIIVSDCNGCSSMTEGLTCLLDGMLAVIGAIELDSRNITKSAATVLRLNAFFPLISFSFSNLTYAA